MGPAEGRVERRANDGGVAKILLMCGGFMGEEGVPITVIQCHSQDEPHRSNHKRKLSLEK